MKNILGAAGAVLVLSAGIASAEIVYECELSVDKTNWVSPTMAIQYDETTGSVLVHDGLAYSVNNDEPIAGKVSRENGDEISFSWSVRSVLDGAGNRTPAFDFRATVSKSAGWIRVKAKPRKYRNSFTGAGTCKKINL